MANDCDERWRGGAEATRDDDTPERRDVCDDWEEEDNLEDSNLVEEPEQPSHISLPRVEKTSVAPAASSSSKGREDIYYYHPRDLVRLENEVNARRMRSKMSAEDYENEVWRREALRYSSAAATATASSLAVSLATLVLACCVLR